MSRQQSGRVGVWMLFVALALGVIGVGLFFMVTGGSQPFQNNDLAKILKEAKWIVLPVPDNSVAPGSVIYFPSEAKSPVVLKPLDHCGVPKDLLTAESEEAPAIIEKSYYKMSLSSVFRTLPAAVSATLSGASSATVQIASHGAERLNKLGDIDTWIQDPNNSDKFSPTCRSYFDQKGYYLVYQAWRITSGTYTFFTRESGGARLNTSGVPKGGSANESVTADGGSDGTVAFKSQTYIAIREVVPTQGGLKFAGSSNHPLAPQENLDVRLMKAWSQ